MAVIAACSFPSSIVTVEHTPPVVGGRFFFPPSAWGFMTQVDEAWIVDGLAAPYSLAGAFGQEGLYSEPTSGQIWPRIG